MKPKILRAVNRDFPCPDCHRAGTWVKQGSSAVRLNSTIYRLKCRRCGAQTVAKAQIIQTPSRGDSACLREEYEVLRRLRSTFPQDTQYGTLEPLEYLQREEFAIMLTRFFPGVDLSKHLLGQVSEGLQDTCRRAGTWLRKLHQSANTTDQLGVPDSADKIDYISRTYGRLLRRDTKTRMLFCQLERWAALVDRQPVRMACNHGDFKPANMLSDGTKYVGLDVHLRDISPAVYDLAPFLNHLWLLGQAVGGYRLKRCYAFCETAFLRGYGDISKQEMLTLRWTQLYFVLCYLGAYSKRGLPAAIYAKWKVRPLGQALARQLQLLA